MPEEIIWARTEFAFPSTDQCSCRRHRTRSGNHKRCHHRNSVIMLHRTLDQGQTVMDGGPTRFYCLDCWSRCRDESTVPNRRQVKMYKQMRRDGVPILD